MRSTRGAATESEDDLEGVVLEDVRLLVGEHVPIMTPLDHHANVTRRMIDNSDLLIGHVTKPHDTVATGRKTTRLMFRMLTGEITPVIGWQKIPMITPRDQFLTSSGPMKIWFDRACKFERRTGVLDVSTCPMQPWLDVAERGWSVLVHTAGDAHLARQIAVELALLAWELRGQFWKSERVSPAEAVRPAVAADRRLVVLSDTGDSVYGGAPGDKKCLVRELFAQNVSCLSLVPVVDAAAVNAAHVAGVAATIKLRVGGRDDHVFSQPVDLTGRVAALSEGVTVEIADRGICENGHTALIDWLALVHLRPTLTVGGVPYV